MSKEIETYNQTEQQFIVDIRKIVEAARTNAYRAINIMQVVSNWLVGKRIVEQEQKGKARADYGKHVIELASAALTEEYGSGYVKSLAQNFYGIPEFKLIKVIGLDIDGTNIDSIMNSAKADIEMTILQSASDIR